MIMLDTNVLSELMRPRPNRKVIDWIDTQNKPVNTIWTPIIGKDDIGVGKNQLSPLPC